MKLAFVIALVVSVATLASCRDAAKSGTDNTEVVKTGATPTQTPAVTASLTDPAPHAPNQFREYLLARMPELLEHTTCQCCDESLATCYRNTLAGHGCPDG